MARSEFFDQWEDPGLAFSDTELAEFKVDTFLEQHLAGVLVLCVVLQRRSELPEMSKPQFMDKVATWLRSRATWEVTKGGLDAIDWDDVLKLPSPTSKDGKALTARALAVVPEEWLPEQRAAAQVVVQQYVTISRRAATAQKWKKADQRKSNQVGYALVKYVEGYDHWTEELESLPKAST